MSKKKKEITKEEMMENLVVWIWSHTKTGEEFEKVLRECGIPEKEIEKYLGK